ncbi:MULTISPECIES: fumarylacetoacetate hydrolase family protein [Amycolatopsis]|uniref:Fumarylacetoacetase-like C-terminal domain-containing protein n=1 Tax=Amycolatopsis dongchuanensis TaxID=1070866 RepID=A0ABP9PTM1_9PSEU
MRLASIRTEAGPALGVGSRAGDTVVRVDVIDPDAPTDILELLALPPDRLRRLSDRADELAGRGGPGVLSVDEAPLSPPVPRPSKVVCLALNYRAHAEEGGFTPPERPVLFLKGPHTLTGHGADIVVPPLSRRIDHEGELAVVIGRRCKDFDGEDWQGAVAGYTMMNDLTARDLQLADIAAQHPWDLSKNFDGFGPVGPWLVTPDEVPDPQALDLEVRVDGLLRQRGSTAQMIFGVRELLVRLSAVMTLEPGDLIATGTPDGIGEVPDGSVVEVRIGDLGVLRNRVTHTPILERKQNQ